MPKHSWVLETLPAGQTNTKRPRPGRPGYRCEACRLTALPPLRGRKVLGWKPPAAPTCVGAA